MTTSYQPYQRILAIDPRRHGFGWAVLEGDALLVDWGIRDVQVKKPERVLAHVAVLIHRYAPHAIVLEDTRHRRCRRKDPARDLIHEITVMSPQADVPIARVSMSRVRKHFRSLGAKNKDTVARVIADRFPELEAFIPPRRRKWMPEHDRMSVFDSIAMALVATQNLARRASRNSVVSRIRHVIRRARRSSKPAA